MNATRLVLSGGGPRGLGILGALHYIDENNGLKKIKEYWGTSVGSIICLLHLIGYSPFEIFHQFFMLQQLIDDHVTLPNILETAALCPIESFGDKVRYYMEKKLGRDTNPTFKELYARFGKKIHIFGTNTDTMSGECFDVDTRPDMKVIDAIEISCDLPYIFTKKEFEGHIYVDGGFVNNYPINLADDGVHNVLGVCVFGDMKTAANDYIGWIYRLLHMPIMELHREHVKRLSEKCVNVEITIDNISIIDMTLGSKKKIETFSSGYRQARDFFVKNYPEMPLLQEDSEHDWYSDFGWSSE